MGDTPATRGGPGEEEEEEEDSEGLGRELRHLETEEEEEKDETMRPTASSRDLTGGDCRRLLHSAGQSRGRCQQRYATIHYGSAHTAAEAGLVSVTFRCKLQRAMHSFSCEAFLWRRQYSGWEDFSAALRPTLLRQEELQRFTTALLQRR